jgi:outer membrane PBP1 activator LpoA protein
LSQDDSYGGRASSAFKRRFEQLGGRVVDILYFNPMHALEDPVRYILDVNEDNQAARVIDFIFLVAKPQQARQIPPLLKFFYAEGVPIYAMSTVYSGTANSALDNDLNGIIFCDSPWVIAPSSRDSGLNTAATQLLTNPAAQERLFAFGVDAFLVAQQISALKNVSQLNVPGVTGQLYMDSSGFVVRNPPCARFSLGVPRVL